MDDGPYWVILLMYGSHDMRHTGFCRLTVVNDTPIFWASQLGPTTRRSKERVLKKGSSFGRWCCPSMLKTKNWGNGLLTGRDHSRFTKYCPEITIGYQALKESHTKGP